MKRLLTGIQPTGQLHIGNYLGAVKNFLNIEQDYETFLMLADLHALTINPDPKQFSNYVLDLAATLIACGVNPQKTPIFVQSLVPAHLELTWILNCITPIGELERMTQYKDKSDKFGANAGLFTYPVLMAADILLYQANYVPVGEDQIQHIELARFIARKFNHHFGPTFVEPEPIITEAKRIMALNNPVKKMSKSIPGSAIGLDDTAEQIRKKIMAAVTDTTPDKKMSPGVTNLFSLLSSFAPNEVDRFKDQFNNGTLKYSELKTTLADSIIAELEPIQNRKKEILANPQQLTEILKKGNLAAQKITEITLKDVKQKVGLLSL